MQSLSCSEPLEEDSEIRLLNPGTQPIDPLPDTLRSVSSHGDVLDFTTVTEMQTLKLAKQATLDNISQLAEEDRTTYTAEDRIPSPINVSGHPKEEEKSPFNRPAKTYEDHFIENSEMLRRQFEIEENNRRLNMKFSSLLSHLQQCKNRLSGPKLLHR